MARTRSKHQNSGAWPSCHSTAKSTRSASFHTDKFNRDDTACETHPHSPSVRIMCIAPVGIHLHCNLMTTVVPLSEGTLLATQKEQGETPCCLKNKSLKQHWGYNPYDLAQPGLYAPSEIKVPQQDIPAAPPTCFGSLPAPDGDRQDTCGSCA